MWTYQIFWDRSARFRVFTFVRLFWCKTLPEHFCCYLKICHFLLELLRAAWLHWDHVCHFWLKINLFCFFLQKRLHHLDSVACEIISSIKALSEPLWFPWHVYSFTTWVSMGLGCLFRVSIQQSKDICSEGRHLEFWVEEKYFIGENMMWWDHVFNYGP